MMNDIKKAAVYIAVVFFIGLLLGWLLYAKCNPLPVIRPSKPDTTLAITKALTFSVISSTVILSPFDLNAYHIHLWEKHYNFY